MLPSPKWKLVVDVGEADPVATVATGKASSSTTFNEGSSDVTDLSQGDNASTGGKDRRIDEVVSLLGELMPSDPNSPLAPYLSGFMSLRLLLLRPSRSPEEEDVARTMLDSYTSYSQGGRARSDIGVMLARDYMFLCQQKANFKNGQSTVANSNTQASALSAYSVFDVHNSPTLAPISIGDSMSIVSN